MFSCCRANPKASKKDKDKQHKKSDEGNDDDEGGDNATNEINEPVAAAVEAAAAQPKPTSESETEKETDAKPNGTLSAKPTTESPQEIESENEEGRSEEHKDQTGIQNILKYIHTYILYILYNNVHSLRILSNMYFVLHLDSGNKKKCLTWPESALLSHLLICANTKQAYQF